VATRDFALSRSRIQLTVNGIVIFVQAC
jgi:hypothetical protein